MEMKEAKAIEVDLTLCGQQLADVEGGELRGRWKK